MNIALEDVAKAPRSVTILAVDEGIGWHRMRPLPPARRASSSSLKSRQEHVLNFNS